jgi:hypothetical protein
MPKSRGASLCLALILAGVLAGVVPALQTDTGAAQGSPGLVDLNDPGQLRARFNGDRGNVRLVLLLSPT